MPYWTDVEVKELFNVFDSDQSGYLDVYEATALLFFVKCPGKHACNRCHQYILDNHCLACRPCWEHARRLNQPVTMFCLRCNQQPGACCNNYPYHHQLDYIPNQFLAPIQQWNWPQPQPQRVLHHCYSAPPGYAMYHQALAMAHYPPPMPVQPLQQVHSEPLPARKSKMSWVSAVDLLSNAIQIGGAIAGFAG